MIIDRDKGMQRCFYHFFIVNVHSTLSAANIGIFMDSSGSQDINKNPVIDMVSADCPQIP